MNSIYNNNKSQQKNIESKNRIKTNSPNESIHLSLILASDMFIPRVKGYDTDKIITSQLKERIYKEFISYSCPPLDVARDFPLFSIIVSKFQRTRESSFILTEFEIYKALGIKREKIISESFCNNFKKLKKSEIKIEIKNKEITKLYEASLIIDFDWDSEEKCFMFQMNDIFLEFFIEDAQYERIYADKFKSLKSGYSKVLYLFLETMKFKYQRSTVFNEDSQLKERFGNNIKRNADKNAKLKSALKQLKEQGIVYEYSRFKSQNENNPLCKIYRDKESFDLDNIDANKEKIKENYALLEAEKRIKDHNENKNIIIPIPLEVAEPMSFAQVSDWENDHPL